MLQRGQIFSILKSYKPKNEDEENQVFSFSLAHASKPDRRSLMKTGENATQRIIAAAIEIARLWRGYACRKKLQQQGIGQKMTESKNSQDVSAVASQDKDYFEDSYSQEDSNLLTVSSVDKHGSRRIAKNDAAVIIQRTWRRHIDMQVFRYYRDLINFKGQGDPAMMLRCINPGEAKLLDAASGIHVRFRLAGEKFPPNIYYKIYTHRPVVDMCANSPKDYTKPPAKIATAKQSHSKALPLYTDEGKEGWYKRYENNGWRLVSDRLIYAAMDPITWESSQKTLEFHHVKLQRRADVEQRRRKRKIDWMRKMYKQGMLKAREADEDTKGLVEKAARGLVHTVDVQGPDAIMDWEVDELLQWTTALNFDDYLEVWKESATSSISELDTTNIKHASESSHQDTTTSGAVPVSFDPYSLTRSSSIGYQRQRAGDVSGPSASTRSGIETKFRGNGDIPNNTRLTHVVNTGSVQQVGQGAG